MSDNWIDVVAAVEGFAWAGVGLDRKLLIVIEADHPRVDPGVDTSPGLRRLPEALTGEVVQCGQHGKAIPHDKLLHAASVAVVHC